MMSLSGAPPSDMIMGRTELNDCIIHKITEEFKFPLEVFLPRIDAPSQVLGNFY